MATALPIDEVLPELIRSLTISSRAILVAPPGAGKTSRVPPALSSAFGGRVLLLEPRRVAARAAAERMASERGDRVGDSIGLRMRGETYVGPRTRIEVVTEGVLVRLLDQDPSLADVSAVIFDEFHERSIDADLGLALTLDVQRLLRPDLRVLVMSATLDDTRIIAALGSTTPIVRSEVERFDVAIEWRPPAVGVDIGSATADAVCDALSQLRAGQSVLAFLPGAAEIRRAQRLLELRGIEARVLHSSGSADARARALGPLSTDERRVVLATTIAQTSLTVPGVATVVDSGLTRTSAYEPRTGLSRLVTLPTSQATARQRTGRAGRIGPGTCIRLWSAASHVQREPHDRPAILDGDLTSITLSLANWGTPLDDLNFVDPLPAEALASAMETLRGLGALDEHDRVTDRGRSIAALPTHPRIGHLLCAASQHGPSTTRRAAILAALLTADIASPLGSDLDASVRAVEGDADAEVADRSWANSIAREADRLSRALIRADGERTMMASDHGRLSRSARFEVVLTTGALLALAYPDRVAVRRRESPDRYDLGDGVATLAKDDPLLGANLLVVADVDGNRRGGRIWSAARVTSDELFSVDAGGRSEATTAVWSTEPPGPSAELWLTNELRWRGTVVQCSRSAPNSEAIREHTINALRTYGLGVLGSETLTVSLFDRLAFLAVARPDLHWAKLEVLGESTDLTWLENWLPGPDQKRPLADIDVAAAFLAHLDRPERRALDELAPTHLILPTGTSVQVSYAHGRPMVRAKIQEVFGQDQTPTLAGVAVSFELLSPAQRPAARTDDLARFWEVGYPQVRAELRGRYPKHDWPLDPRHATPQRGAKRRATP